MQSILSVDGLFGGYLYRKPVIRNLSFTVEKGEMVGLVGLNGAGKSTTIKHILGLMVPEQGEIRVNGVTLSEDAGLYRSSLAFVPESPELYEELTIREHLDLTARVYGIDRQAFEERAERLMALFRMKEKAGSFSRHLSKGMRQKVMLMNAFLIEAPLYVIDEPFLGLDPLGIRSLLELMASFKEKGCSFLISSHILATIEKYCDRYVVLERGEMAAGGTLDDICRQAGLPTGASLDDAFFRLVGGGEGGGL
ncbi:ABC transporter ATP-binding protein [Gorillibacterium sp. CAU 1737]|uniref:ABC transporter ATP-binding protein n=1 Tax=Gorillibacterium sp. CAU 1737 TaxID=3140362 RepID=UPI003261242E